MDLCRNIQDVNKFTVWCVTVSALYRNQIPDKSERRLFRYLYPLVRIQTYVDIHYPYSCIITCIGTNAIRNTGHIETCLGRSVISIVMLIPLPRRCRQLAVRNWIRPTHKVMRIGAGWNSRSICSIWRRRGSSC